MNEKTVGSLRKVKDNNGQFLWQPPNQAGEPDRVPGFRNPRFWRFGLVSNRHQLDSLANATSTRFPATVAVSATSVAPAASRYESRVL